MDQDWKEEEGRVQVIVQSRGRERKKTGKGVKVESGRA